MLDREIAAHAPTGEKRGARSEEISIMTDLAERFPQNPILAPQDIEPSLPELKLECLLNPGCFRFDDKTWLLLRVAERPGQVPGKTIAPIFHSDGEIGSFRSARVPI